MMLRRLIVAAIFLGSFSAASAADPVVEKIVGTSEIAPV
jgi:hypothetical protein